VSCKASLAALRLYGFLWYCYDDVLSENKYDDDDGCLAVHLLVTTVEVSRQTVTANNKSTYGLR